MANKNLYNNRILKTTKSCGALEEAQSNLSNLVEDTSSVTSVTPSDISSFNGGVTSYSAPPGYEGVSSIKDIYNVQKQIIEDRRAQGGLKSDESIIWIPVVINIYALPEECDDQGYPLGFGVGHIPSLKWWYNLIDIMNLIFAGEYEGQGPDITSLGLRWDDDDNYIKAIQNISHGIRSRIRFAIAPNDDTGSDFTNPAINIIPILKALKDVPFAVPSELADKTILPGSGGYTPTDPDTFQNKFIDAQGRGNDGSRKDYLPDYLKSKSIFISGVTTPAREADNPGGADSRNKFLILNFAQLKSSHGLAGSAQFPGRSSNKIVFMNTNHNNTFYGMDLEQETFDRKFAPTLAHEIGHALGLWHNFDHISSSRSLEEQIFLNAYLKEASHKATYIEAATQNLFDIIPNNIHLLYLKSSEYEHTESNVLFEDSIMHNPSDNPEDSNYVPEFHFDNLLQKRQEYEPYVQTGAGYAHFLSGKFAERGKIPSLKRFAKVDLSELLNIDMSSFKNIVCDPYFPNRVNISLFKTSDIYDSYNENGIKVLYEGVLSLQGHATYGIGHDNDEGNPYSNYPYFIQGTTVETLFSEQNCPCLYTKHKMFVGENNSVPVFEQRYPMFPATFSGIQVPNFYFTAQNLSYQTFSNNISFSPNETTTPVTVMPNKNVTLNDGYTNSNFIFSTLTYNEFINKFKDPNNLSVAIGGDDFSATYATIVNHIHNVYTSAGFYLDIEQRRKFETYITDYRTQLTPGKVRSEFYGTLHASFYGSFNNSEIQNNDQSNVASVIDPYNIGQIYGNWYDLDSNPYDIFMMHLARYSIEALRDYSGSVPEGFDLYELSEGQISNPSGLFSIGGVVGPQLTKSKLIQKSLDTFGRYPLNNTGDSTMSWSSIFNLMNYRLKEPGSGGSTLNGTVLTGVAAVGSSYVSNDEKYGFQRYTSNTTFSPYQLLMMEYNVLKGEHGFQELTSFSETLQTSGWPTNTMYIPEDTSLCSEGLQITSTPYYLYNIDADGNLIVSTTDALENNFYSIGNDLVDSNGNFYNGVFSYNPSTIELLDNQGNILYSLASAVQANIDLNLGETVEKMKKFSAIYNKIVNFTN